MLLLSRIRQRVQNFGRLLLQGLVADQTLEMCLAGGWGLGSLQSGQPEAVPLLSRLR